MKRKALFAIPILLFVPLLFLGAKVLSQPDIDVQAGPLFCFPTAEYLKEYPGDPSIQTPPVRTSAYLCIDIDPFQFGYCNEASSWSIGASLGFSYLRVSPSVAYGFSVLKGYEGFGVNLSVQASLKRFSLDAAYRMLACHYVPNFNRFLVQEVELRPAYTILEGLFSMQVFTPIALSIKADALSLRFGCGLSFSLNAAELEKRL